MLDVARIFKARIKNWAYAWRMTKDTKWLDRAWVELNVSRPSLLPVYPCLS